ncbi:MAG TPA: TerD family protein [Candidatus Obscuribacter sp.]|nr:TerD family protein [Candidatus Obscuribacter sp.]MBK9280333.1 TerD family protein [Candidatus Obscuribacter sp.]HNB17689.1 TerD family protein [Candidatus Obscuribacter sp.]HND05518.1 TerD family protein [Candidatus Obscuribacter sp.]HND67103.1 TerD family protein [Candidatus Obscuribacter sp.]
MAVSLAKGNNVNLAKEAPGVFKFRLGLGWDARATDGEKFDLDASAFGLNGATGKVNDEKDFIFYGEKVHASGAITYNGDNRTGEGAGDDESISIDTSKMPANIQKVAFTVTIDKADERRQTFGMVNNAYIRVVDENTGTEIARFDLSEDYSVETAMIFGELYLHNGEWKFKAIGQGFANGLAGVCGNFGVEAA